jgi:surface antigen
MFKSRRSLSLLLTALVVFSTSVFLFPQKVSAQEPLPLPVAQEMIEQQKEAVDNKTSILIGAEQEIESLVAKKQSLATELETIKQDLEKLKNEVAEKKAAAEREKKRVEELRNMFVHVNRYAGNSAGNLYAPGNCTWYAKSRRPDLPNNLGNANTWYARAVAQGWNVGLTPKKGAVATTTAGSLGHVAYVEGVSLDGQWVTISEMNYRGLYSMNTRTVHYTEFRYIYELD